MSADNLQDKNSAGRAGMSTLDLLGGSVAVNRVVKIMLHKNRMTHQELVEAISKLPPEKQMTSDELGVALDDLIGKEWLSRTEEGGTQVYQVVLRPKASSAEQLHSDDLPKIDIAVDKDINPNLHSDMGDKKKSDSKGDDGLMGTLKNWFGVKK